MITPEKNPSEKLQSHLSIYLGMIFLLLLLVSCSPSPEDLAAVDFTPLPGADWEVSTPEAEGLDPDMVAELYYDAAKLDTCAGYSTRPPGFHVLKLPKSGIMLCNRQAIWSLSPVLAENAHPFEQGDQDAQVGIES